MLLCFGVSAIGMLKNVHCRYCVLPVAVLLCFKVRIVWDGRRTFAGRIAAKYVAFSFRLTARTFAVTTLVASRRISRRFTPAVRNRCCRKFAKLPSTPHLNYSFRLRCCATVFHPPRHYSSTGRIRIRFILTTHCPDIKICGSQSFRSPLLLCWSGSLTLYVRFQLNPKVNHFPRANLLKKILKTEVPVFLAWNFRIFGAPSGYFLFCCVFRLCKRNPKKNKRLLLHTWSGEMSAFYGFLK